MSTDLTSPSTVVPPSLLAVADDYYRVTLGIENTIYAVALALTTGRRRQVLGHILAIIPDAERVLLVDRIAELAVAWTNAHLDGDEAAMEAASADLYRVCRATARLVATESADAVAAYREVFEPAGGAS